MKNNSILQACSNFECSTSSFTTYELLRRLNTRCNVGIKYEVIGCTIIGLLIFSGNHICNVYIYLEYKRHLKTTFALLVIEFFVSS